MAYTTFYLSKKKAQSQSFALGYKQFWRFDDD